MISRAGDVPFEGRVSPLSVAVLPLLFVSDFVFPVEICVGFVLPRLQKATELGRNIGL